MTALLAISVLSLAIWCYLLAANGRFWLADRRLPPEPDGPDAASAAIGGPDITWPDVTAVVPARDEAAMLPLSLPTLLAQDYPGRFRVVLVDDASTDETARIAEKLGAAGARDLTVVRGDGPPPGWAGKVAAMDRGVTEATRAGTPEFLLFTDADIAHPADSVRRLVRFALAERLDLVSLMARLRTDTAAERAIVPAFVDSFAQLYPFPRVNRPGARTAAAAGGCMLVRHEALRAAGGLVGIAGARIDDVALGRLLKRGRHGGGRVWLGLTTAVRSIRPYPRLADLWDMIARSAYTQLRYSPWLLAGTLLVLLLTYAAPPVLGLTGLALALAGAGGGTAAWLAATALAAWALMSLSYLPTLRLYRLRAWRAPALPAVMLLYAAMTADSARRHYRRLPSWKGR